MTDQTRNGRFAEWVLSLAMPVDRARAMLGDIEEDRCGGLRFWFRIVAIVGAFTGRGIAKDGLRVALWSMIWWGFVGFVLANWWLLGYRIQHGWNLPPHTSYLDLIGIGWRAPGNLGLLWAYWVWFAGRRSWGQPLAICAVAGSVWIGLSFLTDVSTQRLLPHSLLAVGLLVATLRARANDHESESEGSGLHG